IALCCLAAPPAMAAKKGGRTVSVIRDSAGIPHIRAKNFFDLGAGEGYAFAQDNLCTLADAFVTVNGQRSKFFGPDAPSVYYSAGVSDPNIKSDMYWKYVKASKVVQNTIKRKPPIGPLPQVRQLYKGFVLGYNAYLKSGKLKDPRCKGKPWVRPITLMDMYLRGEQIVTAGASAQLVSGQVDAQPPAASGKAAPASQPDFPALKQLFGDASDPTLGSNGIGLGNQGTRNKTGMVLANPHFPWRGTERFWMAHLTVPGQYDVMGGTLEGFPLIGIGFNRHLAWTHTVSTARRFTFFQLKLAPGDPTSYIVDGKTEKMKTVTVTVETPSGPQKHTFYTTRYGTVVNVPQAGYGWTTDTAYALGDSVKTALSRSANQFLRSGQARTVDQFLAVQHRFLATPTFTTEAADDRGKALFTDVGNVPNVSQAKIDTCIPDGLPKLVFAQGRVVTLDGSRAACNWDNDPGTPAKGIFNGSHLPHLFRRDYVENSNDSYWLANPAKPLTGFSPIIGLTGTQQSFRTRLGNEMIAQRFAGTDGQPGRKFTIPTLQGMWENNRSKLAELVLDDLVSGCRAHPAAIASDGQPVDLTPACDALAAYNKTGNLGAKGGWLFSEWNRMTPGAGFWSDSFDPNNPLSTPSKMNTDNPAIYTGLADAVNSLRANNVPLDATYGAVQHTPRGKSRIPIHGCSTGCFNAITASNGLSTSPVSQAPYGEVISGSSLVMTTELRKGGPVSEGILTYSQATDPTSPWFANMTRLYSKKRWVKLRYSRRDLARDKHLTETRLVVR
ncbi:MAG: acyl-homoserine-lactone acylase, partial [Thermoleophilaceae bacterium]|nr:acyl-homoserine-lactone acylase [Thermoleophilaceae bacterium]